MNDHIFKAAVLAQLTMLAGCGEKRTEVAPVPVRLQAAAAAGTSAAYYSGTIEARNAVPLSFLTAGTVTSVLVDEGQAVEKGQKLAALDCQNNESALRMAEAKNTQAQDAFRRFEPMYKHGNLPEIRMVEIETARTEAEQALKLAQKSASDCTITAPAPGLISRRSLEPGSSAIPGKPVLELAAIDQVYAEIAVPETEISGIRQGRRAEVRVAAVPQAGQFRTEGPGAAAKGAVYGGAVSETGVSADPLSRTYRVRVLVNNPGRRLLPGMLCDVNITGGAAVRMVLVPAGAVSYGDAGEFVYVADGPDGAVKRRAVRTAGFAQGGVLVSSGLAEGELVVSDGAQKLSDGTRIKAEPL